MCYVARCICCLLILVSLLTDTYVVSAQTVYYKHFTVKDGLAGNHVYMCHQDIDGYMWVATTSGLSRFDGKQFKNYDYEDGLQDNEVLFVTNDCTNRIWVNSFSARNAISILETELHSTNIEVVKTEVINVPTLSEGYYSKKNKTTYLTGGKTLVIIDKNNKYRLLKGPFISGSPVFETEDGNCYAGDGFKLYKIGDSIISYVQALNLPSPYLRLSYYDNVLYAASGRQVVMYRYIGQSFNYIGTKHFEARINQIRANKYGLWISFENRKGGYLYDEGISGKLRYEVSIPGFINNIADDVEGGMWLSTNDNGLFYIPNPEMINFTVKDGLASSVVYALAPVGNNRLWLGHNTGQAELVYLYDGYMKKEKQIDVEAGNNNNSFVLDIVNTNSYGTFFLSRNQFAHYEGHILNPVNVTSTYKSLYLLRDSLLGIGGWEFCIYNMKNGHADTHKIARVYAQCCDELGGFWLGNTDGLYVIKETKRAPEKIKALNGLKINALISSGSYIWVGTQNNGLYLLQGDSVVLHINNKEEKQLLSNTIKALAISGEKLYVGTNRGLVSIVFDYRNLHISRFTILNHNDGLLSPEVNDIKVDSELVYVATYGGLVVFANALPTYHIAYKLSDLSVKNLHTNEYTDIAGAIIPYSENGIEFGFNTVALRFADEISYKYKLDGFDYDWKYTKTNNIQYTNILPGEYSFIVSAFDSRGNKSPDYKIHIIIKPAVWQTWWFEGLVLLLVLFILALSLYWYSRYTKRRTNVKLEHGRMVAKAKLEALRAQLKPHFIFNSMNAINDYLHNNKNEDATELLSGFASLIRKGLRIAANDFTTIAEETSFLLQYLKLEQKKCDNCFEFQFDVEEKNYNIVIPSLITQPFVENAIVHGVRNIKGRRALLQITYALSNNDLICTIIDNGVGFKKSLLHKKTDSLGTNISENRIAYFNTGLGIDIDLKITDLSDIDAALSGTQVVIVIKNIHQFQEHENNFENINN